jgi:hemolysin D
MSNFFFRDLADCSEFRQTLLARPPAVLHGTAILLVGLVGVALAWLALTRADLVVRASGHVRPVTTPCKVIAGANGETLSATLGGRVIAVRFREGDEVCQGQVLVKLETSQLDSEIAKSRRALLAGEEELAQLKDQELLLESLRLAATSKAEAELAHAREKVRQAELRQVQDIRLAEVERDGAGDELARMKHAGPGAAAAELVKATLKLGETEAKLQRARLPVERGEVRVADHALALVAKDYALRRNELVTKRGARSGEVDTARIQLAKLEQEREQAVIRAPIGGIVTKADVKPGDILTERGKPVAEVAEQNGFLFEASVPNEDIGRLRAGMPVRLKLDAFDYQKYGTLGGTVSYIAPDSGPPDGQRPTTYTVKIKLAGNEVERGDVRGRVKLGMSGQVDIITGRESLLLLLLRKIRQGISLG